MKSNINNQSLQAFYSDVRCHWSLCTIFSTKLRKIDKYGAKEMDTFSLFLVLAGKNLHQCIWMRKGMNMNCYVSETLMFHSLQTFVATSILQTRKTFLRESLDCSQKMHKLECCVCVEILTAVTTIEETKKLRLQRTEQANLWGPMTKYGNVGEKTEKTTSTLAVCSKNYSVPAYNQIWKDSRFLPKLIIQADSIHTASLQVSTL